MLSWLRNFGRSLGEAISLRRWDAAKVNRLNSHQHAQASGNSINEDLNLDRETLVKRSMHEAENNPFVEGVIQTHTASIVGSDGPVLQVVSDRPRYNDYLEQIWREFWEKPDLSGVLSGTELLQECVRLLWCCGEFFLQEVADPDAAEDEISLRLNRVHPRRVTNPWVTQNARIVMGVERDPRGRPVTYYVVDMDADEYGWLGDTTDPLPQSAERIIHGFRSIEPGQVRGVPWIAPCLQTIADLREYDQASLDAARQAADFAVLLVTNHPDSQYVEVNESTTIQRRQIATVPPGWDAKQIDPKHPTTNYAEYRKEKLRELGRPVNMPLMMTILDSGNHNYSSARFDGQLYNRGVQCLQSWLERIVLRRVLKRVEREAVLARMIPMTPDRVQYSWTWPVAPHVDPQKEAKAWETLLAIGGASEFDVAASMGRDFETIVAARQRAQQLLDDAGITLGGTSQPAMDQAETDDEDDDEDEQNQQPEAA